MPQPNIIVCWVQPPRHTHTHTHTNKKQVGWRRGTVVTTLLRCCAVIQCCHTIRVWTRVGGGVRGPRGPKPDGASERRVHGGTGGATPRFWTPTTPQTNCWPEAPWGGGRGGGIGGGGSGRGEWGGGSRRGGAPGESVGGGGGPSGAIRGGGGGGGSRWGREHRLPLPPLALPLTIPSP